jgi:hypothetical protein
MTGGRSGGLVGGAGFLLPLMLVAAVLSEGCGTTTVMSEPAVRTAVLLGPVACIGCAPAIAAVPLGPPITDSSLTSYMGGGGVGIYAWERKRVAPSLDLTLSRAVRDPCRADLRISRLRAGAYGLFALFVVKFNVSVDLESAAVAVPSGSCWAPPVEPTP